MGVPQAGTTVGTGGNSLRRPGRRRHPPCTGPERCPSGSMGRPTGHPHTNRVRPHPVHRRPPVGQPPSDRAVGEELNRSRTERPGEEYRDLGTLCVYSTGPGYSPRDGPGVSTPWHDGDEGHGPANLPPAPVGLAPSGRQTEGRGTRQSRLPRVGRGGGHVRKESCVSARDKSPGRPVVSRKTPTTDPYGNHRIPPAPPLRPPDPGPSPDRSHLTWVSPVPHGSEYLLGVTGTLFPEPVVGDGDQPTTPLAPRPTLTLGPDHRPTPRTHVRRVRVLPPPSAHVTESRLPQTLPPMTERVEYVFDTLTSSPSI